MQLPQILDSLMNQRNISAYKISQKTGISDRLIGYWRKGDKLPSAENILIIANYFGITTDYLLTGRESNLAEPSLSTIEQELLEYYKKLSEKEQLKLLGRLELLAELAEEERKKNKPAPKVKRSKPADEESLKTITMRKFKDAASAGKGIELGDGDYEEITVIDTTLTEKADIAIRVSGDSMEPDYCDGETVLVRLTPYVEFNEIGIFRADNCGYIKKKGCDRLISINREREDILFSDHSEVVAIGRVIGKLNPDWITD